MFNGITNYLFGGFLKSDEVPQVAADDSTNLTLTLEDDGDWMLVNTDSAADAIKTSTKVVSGERPLTEGIKDVAPVQFRKPLAIRQDEWFITPPSCFTSEQRSRKRLQAMAISPLENLLIEHPSMSIYTMYNYDPYVSLQFYPGRLAKVEENNIEERPEKLKRKSHGKIQAKRLQMLKDSKPQSNAININDACIHKKLNQVIRNLEQEAHGQKLVLRNQAKCLTMKQFDRQNKIQDYQSKRQKQRRKDHSHRPSGRSNDRKC